MRVTTVAARQAAKVLDDLADFAGATARLSSVRPPPPLARESFNIDSRYAVTGSTWATLGNVQRSLQSFSTDTAPTNFNPETTAKHL